MLPGGGAPLVRALRVAAAVGGKFGGAAAFILLYVYTIELFPTVVRNAALGANSSSARLGGVLAPLIVLVAAEMNAAALSFAVFGITSMLAGACSLTHELLRLFVGALSSARRCGDAPSVCLLCSPTVSCRRARGSARRLRWVIRCADTEAWHAGALCMLMPETQGKPLADTIEDIQGFSNYDADEAYVADEARRANAVRRNPAREAAADAFQPRGAGDERFVLTEDEASALEEA